jgi:hypothetical protein
MRPPPTVTRYLPTSAIASPARKRIVTQRRAWRPNTAANSTTAVDTWRFQIPRIANGDRISVAATPRRPLNPQTLEGARADELFITVTPLPCVSATGKTLYGIGLRTF